MPKMTATHTFYPYELEGTVSEIIAKLEGLRDARGDVFIAHYSDRYGDNYFEYQYEREENEPDNFSFKETHRDGKLFDLEEIVQNAAKRKPWVRSE